MIALALVAATAAPMRFRWNETVIERQRVLDACIKRTWDAVIDARVFREAAYPRVQNEAVRAAKLIRRRCSTEDQQLAEARHADLKRLKIWSEAKRKRKLSQIREGFWEEMPNSILYTYKRKSPD